MVESIEGYRCAGCGSGAFQRGKYVRVDHDVNCKHWREVRDNFPRLVRMIKQQRRLVDAK